MKCQRQLLQISWQQFIRNDEVAATTGLPSISEVISNRRSALFGHVTRLQQDVPAHKALRCHVDLSLGRPPNDQWKRRPGRPRERWIDQVRKDNGIPPGGSVEACDESWSPRSNATALAGFALTTTTTMVRYLCTVLYQCTECVFIVSRRFKLSLSIARVYVDDNSRKKTYFCRQKLFCQFGFYNGKTAFSTA